MARETTTTKKRSVKKATKKSGRTIVKDQRKASPRKAVKPETVTAVAVQEVFQTNPPAPEVVQVAPNSVLLFVNGSNRGLLETNGLKLGEFTVSQAQRAGIRSFSVYVDGAKASTADQNAPLDSVSKVEIVSKDSRA